MPRVETRVIRWYKFVWRDGKTDYAEGADPAEALTSLGYGSGALPALDYWTAVPDVEAKNAK